MNVSITDAELEVMRLLWREKKALTIAELRTELERSKNWNKSTINTLVSRLLKKCAIARLDRYGAAQYIPVVTEDDYMLAEEKALLEKFGNAKNLAIAMVRNGHLTDDDIIELQNYFKMGDDLK